MSLRAWLRPPRHWLGLFLLITLAPSVLLIWFGWRSLQQDRTLALQAVQERRNQTADLVVSGLEQSVAAAEQSLRDSSAASALAEPEGAVVVVLAADHVEAFPKKRLLYYPLQPTRLEASGQFFAAAEDLEFRRSDYTAAAASLRQLAFSDDPAVRSGALVRLARNLRKSGDIAGALDAYSRAEQVRGVAVNGVPADLLARWARCDLLAQERRNSQLQEEASNLGGALLSGQWRLSRAAYQFHVEEVRRWLGAGLHIPPDAQALSEAVEWLWNRSRSTPSHAISSTDRETVPIDGIYMTILRRTDASGITALIATPSYVQRQWLSKLAPLMNRQHVRTSLQDRNQRGATGQSRRNAGETGLPWTVAVESTGVESELDRVANRRALWLTGLAVLAALVIGGTCFIARAVSRELAVARLQSDFVSAVSHEFRTPLTSMRQLTEVLNDGRVANEDRRLSYYQALARQTERLHRLVESLLDFGRMEAGTTPYRMEPLDAYAFIRSVVADFEAEAAGRGYHVELEIEGAEGAIVADRAALTNALWNLLDNAVKYSPECHTVWVAVQREGRLLSIRVRDQGLGIPVEEQEEIFRKFIRGTAAKAENIKGTGIGLAMVSHIVKAHRGNVSVSSAPGAGSTFTLLLPIEEICRAS
jgi:signal transduction histidine kinase